VNWNSGNIRNLRRRLGWTAADLARRLAVPLSRVQAWEASLDKPDADSLNQFRYLNNWIDTLSMRMSQMPLAERFMSEKQLGQITTTDLHQESGEKEKV
jgi:transcriptional regulator with XRE-family HTH domain